MLIRWHFSVSSSSMSDFFKYLMDIYYTYCTILIYKFNKPIKERRNEREKDKRLVCHDLFLEKPMLAHSQFFLVLHHE